MKAIGPSFAAELENAGLLTLPFSWGADGAIQFGDGITAEQRAAVDAVLAAHDPTAVPPPEPATWTGAAWQPDIPAVRAAAIERIKAERDRREVAGFDYLGRRIDSDPRAVQRMSVAEAAARAALAAGAPLEFEWTCADNSTLALDADGVVGMLCALAVYGDHLHQTARALKAAVALADTPDTIEAAATWPA